MIAEPRAPEPAPPGEPVPCGTCRQPAVHTVLGWTHLNEHGVPDNGWLCRLRHVALARPRPRSRPTPIPAGQAAYASALSALDQAIATAARVRLRRALERIERAEPPVLREFDLIRGLTGLGAYLLRRHGGGDLLSQVLCYLVRLTQPIEMNGQRLPGWWTANGPADRPSPHWPSGHGNLGMAHGVAGPLALLSTAMTRGVTVPGQADAIGEICVFLDHWRRGSRAQAWWPGMISLSEWRAGTTRHDRAERPSWCYGTPGLARAQQLAAVALGDEQRQEAAEHALAACLADERQLAQLGDASLCHGWAGLALIAWRAAADSVTGLAARLPHVRDCVRAHLRRCGPPPAGGLLEGAAGVRLAQLTTTVATPPATQWDACLLTAG